jgi:hypothetical protein
MTYLLVGPGGYRALAGALAGTVDHMEVSGSRLHDGRQFPGLGWWLPVQTHPINVLCVGGFHLPSQSVTQTESLLI